MPQLSSTAPSFLAMPQLSDTSPSCFATLRLSICSKVVWWCCAWHGSSFSGTAVMGSAEGGSEVGGSRGAARHPPPWERDSPQWRPPRPALGISTPGSDSSLLSPAAPAAWLGRLWRSFQPASIRERARERESPARQLSKSRAFSTSAVGSYLCKSRGPRGRAPPAPGGGSSSPASAQAAQVRSPLPGSDGEARKRLAREGTAASQPLTGPLAAQVLSTSPPPQAMGPH
ncbi:hypothetical protein KIL84_002727 [Mauremys mutica]|uniref:Uncharacterized protein n=1 Tax=Mauremys mutica TaxID=74926 RepID=A0A9D3WNE2_9SAUR|nr:hypothetical protein KIL84_002727 [Mauremys mutica]